MIATHRLAPRALAALTLSALLLAGACTESHEPIPEAARATPATAQPTANTPAKPAAGAAQVPAQVPAKVPAQAANDNLALPAELDAIPSAEEAAAKAKAQINEANANAEFEKLAKEIENDDG